MNFRPKAKRVVRVVGWNFLAFALVGSSSRETFAAEVITGQVRNQTQSQPAVGNVVVLLRPEHSMREEARTHTDSRGRFSVSVRDSDKTYLLRVVHQGVNYDERVATGDSVSIGVFDCAVKVEGLTGSIEIIRVATTGTQLHVSDMIGIENRSSPPSTQAGDHTFDVYLPANARIDSVLAAGPENIGVMISATPAPGDRGHYSVNYPLLPGTTKLAFNYDLPYAGRATFRTGHAYPLQQLAVMIPPSMKFSSSSPAFKLLPAGNQNYQVRAIGAVQAGPGPEFEISGRGAVAAIRGAEKTEAPTTALVPPARLIPQPSASRLSPLQSQSSATRSPSENFHTSRLQPWYWRFWPLAVPALVVAVVGVLAIRRARQAKRISASQAAGRTREPAPASLEGLKEELFQLEAAKIRGSISVEQYRSTRSTLEESVRRAVRGAY